MVKKQIYKTYHIIGLLLVTVGYSQPIMSSEHIEPSAMAFNNASNSTQATARNSVLPQKKEKMIFT